MAYQTTYKWGRDDFNLLLITIIDNIDVPCTKMTFLPLDIIEYLWRIV